MHLHECDEFFYPGALQEASTTSAILFLFLNQCGQCHPMAVLIGQRIRARVWSA
jgi:hypothetical protein